ncbi:hypothetical protein [Fodinibius salsisoli]|uniref:Porin n=1 Tax=Fodinibius salsisoli TaxID=2820877 RepID=A0ABT3PQJ5_9BACT|nr:hypothetical protein [Fodinibius salsisoli]MCW9708105.1 hypothetical protein [Fodinibius salsisoli]
MRYLLFTYGVIICLGLPMLAVGQIDNTTIDSVRIDTTVLADTSAVQTIDYDAPDQKSEKPSFTVVPWMFHAPLGAHVTASDSTLRWQNWPDWTYKLNREPGIISYRMGTSLRSNAVQRFAHEPRHQQLYWEGININDPVSGNLNWSLIPQHKIDRVFGQDLGTQYRTTYYLRQYYLNKPLSRLLYSESKFTNRDLEFEVSHNLSQQTNVELSYWDRRSGGEYPNSEVIGRQIFAKVSHHLDPQHLLKVNYVNNKLDIGRPFGYLMGDLRTFNFDRFQAQANQSSGQSAEVNNLFAINLYRRNENATDSTDNFHVGLYQRSTERTLQYSADSTAYKVRSVGLTSRKWWSLGNLNTEGGLSYEYFFNKKLQNSSLDTDNWGLLNAEAKLSLDIGSLLTIHGNGGFQYRDDAFQGNRLSAGADVTFGKLTLSPALSVGSNMPTPQQLYWQSESYAGNPTLSNENIREGRAELKYAFTKDTHLGIRVQHKDIENGIMFRPDTTLPNLDSYAIDNGIRIKPDSTFKNVDPYASQSATAFFSWDATHFEFEGSATLHQFTNSLSEPGSTIPMWDRQRIWFKGGAYWKGYLFGRATYVKAGLSGIMSPSRYQADHYSPELDYWQSVSGDQELPIFNRLDVDISARLRSIVFVLRWQNVLDDVSQLGYFETAQYPMSQRKFIFSVRALFRN